MEEGQAVAQPEVLALEIASKILGDSPEEVKEEAAQPETEVAETETEATAETTTEEQPQPKPRFKLTVKTEGGADEEVEVDEDELKKGYMMQRDYQRKTAELAREREAVAEKVKLAVEPTLKEYQTRLQLFEKAIWHKFAPEIQNTDWNALARDNPAEWAQKMQQANEVNSILNAVRQEQQKLEAQKQQEQQTVKQKQIQEAVETLQREIPGWNNDLYKEVMQTGIKLGYKAEEVAQITDPVAIKALHLAGELLRLKEAKPTVEKRVASVPKVVKPGTSEKSNANADKRADALKRLQRSGRIDDAAKFALAAGLV